MKRGFNKIYEFPKQTLDYSTLYRSRYFWCHDTTLKNISLVKKLNLTWNKHTKFNKLYPVFPLKVWKILKPSFG